MKSCDNTVIEAFSAEVAQRASEGFLICSPHYEVAFRTCSLPYGRGPSVCFDPSAFVTSRCSHAKELPKGLRALWLRRCIRHGLASLLVMGS
jgi:hypothetical protein